MKFVRLHDMSEDKVIDVNLAMVTEICITPYKDLYRVTIEYHLDNWIKITLDATGLHTLEMGMGVK